MKVVRDIFIVILFALILSEGVLQVSYHVAPHLMGVVQKINSFSGSNPYINYHDSDYWKKRFIEAYERNTSDKHGLMHGTHLPHKTRGWTPKPHLSLIRDGYRYTTNNLGHRALKDYAYDKDQYQVLIVGDSYTFGIDADDSCVWPNMLQAMDGRLNVVNLAVGGYGIGQMVITLRETIRFYRPDLVVVAFVGEDIRRAMLDFRDYKKPKFEIEGDRLVLTNTPVGSLEEVYRETFDEMRQKTFDLKYIKLDNVLNRLYATINKRPVSDVAYENRLFDMLLEQMHDTAARAGADFLAVYLATGPEMWNQAHHSPEEAAFLDFVRKSGVEHINTREYFLQTNGHYASGHYRAAEARQVSSLVYGKIERLAAFRQFVKIEDELKRP
jgi:hypothetical protein